MNLIGRQNLPALLALALACALLAAPAGLVRAADDTHIVFQEDFQHYQDTPALRAVWQGGNAELDIDAPGGGKAARHDGGSPNYLGGFSATVTATNNLVFYADIYDFGTNSEKRLTVMLKNNRGDCLEFGYVPKPLNAYAVRISGFARPIFLTPFNNSNPVKGWHHFRGIISSTNTTVTLDPDLPGWEGRTLSFDGPPPRQPFNQVRFGGLSGRKYPGFLLVDNIELASTAVTTAAPTAAAQEPTPIEVSIEPPAITPPVGTNSVAAASLATTAVPAPALMSDRVLWGIFAALSVIIILLGALVVSLRRAARASAALSVAVTGEAPHSRGMLSELTEFAKQALVQGLYSQRKALLETQRRAQQELVELEARLAALHLPLQDRIRVYEKRIAELEKQLESQNAEMRELTQMTLRLMREKLAQEKGQPGQGWRIMEKGAANNAFAKTPQAVLAKLVIRCEDLAPETIHLKIGTNTFGRDSENDFKIEHSTVSRCHCEVTVDGDGLSVRDLGSHNGTFIDDQPVLHPTPLRKGQVLRIGDVKMEVREAPGPASALICCANHPAVPASMKCGHCGKYFCGSCVHILSRRNGQFLRLCPSCSGHCEPMDNPAAPGNNPGAN